MMSCAANIQSDLHISNALISSVLAENHCAGLSCIVSMPKVFVCAWNPSVGLRDMHHWLTANEAEKMSVIKVQM